MPKQQAKRRTRPARRGICKPTDSQTSIPIIPKVKWTPEHDKCLIRAYNNAQGNGTISWADVSSLYNKYARKVFVSDSIIIRNPKQCRERYINCLDPEVDNGPFRLGEKEFIVQTGTEQNHKWGDVAKLVRTKFGIKRSNNFIKNAFYARVRAEKSRIARLEQEANAEPISAEIVESAESVESADLSEEPSDLESLACLAQVASEAIEEEEKLPPFDPVRTPYFHQMTALTLLPLLPPLPPLPPLTPLPPLSSWYRSRPAPSFDDYLLAKARTFSPSVTTI